MDSPRSETILLVEDEELLRSVVGEGLSAMGYRVLTAGSGEEAVEIAGRHAGNIQVLVTDLLLAELSGPQVAKQVTAARPETKVIFISGFPGGAIAPGGELEPGVVLLQKPFTIRRLAEQIQEVLGQEP